MRKKLAVLLALCMVAGTIGNPAGIQEVRAAELQGTVVEEALGTFGEDAVIAETDAVKYDSGDFEYEETEDAGTVITKYKGNAQECVIPSVINGIKINGIDIGALSGCDNLYSVTIPYSVCIVDIHSYSEDGSWTAPENVFKTCSSLKEIIVDNGNANYSSQDGMLFDREKTRLICCPAGKEGSVIIPEGVTTIENSSFADCHNITSVTISRTVTGIANEIETDLNASVFQNCSALEEIIVDSSNEKYSSRDGILYNKEQTNIICCPENKTGVVEISGRVTGIGDVFKKCTKITEFVVDENNQVFSSQGGILFSNGNTNILRWPGEAVGIVEIPESVMNIGTYAFSNYHGITGIKIPDTVTNVGAYAFSGCTGLKEVKIPDTVTNVGAYAFSGCSNLNSVILPDGIAKLNSNLFNGCTGLKEIKIPDTVTSIDEYAFSGCNSLSNIMLPEGIEILATGIFKDCTKIDNIEIPGSVTKIAPYVFSGCSSLRNIMLPMGVTSIGNNAFENCCSLTDINIPNTLVSISWNSVFENCSSLLNVSIDKEHGAYSLVDGAVYDKDGVTLLFCPGGRKGSLSIPAGVTKVSCTFANCADLEEIIVDNGNEKYYSWDGMLFYKEENDDGEKSVSICACPPGKKDSNISLKDVNVASGAFESCNNLQEIEIKGKYVEIRDNAFNSCSSLQKVSMQSGRTVIQKRAFTNCSKLQKVICNNDTKGEFMPEAFYICENIEEVSINNGLVTGNAFKNCNNLQKVTISGRSYIFKNAFSNCDNLQNVIIKDGGGIYGYAFSNCNNLQEVIISGNRWEISGNAFGNCSNLQNVTILDVDNMDDISASAFSGCSSELHIYCEKDSAGQEYAAANNIPYIIINRKEQTITASNITKSTGDEPFLIEAATDGDGELSYECYNDEVIIILEDGIVTIVGEGTAEVTITASGTVACKSAEKIITITVTSGQAGTEKKVQTITASDITKTVNDKPFSINAATDGNGELSFESSNESVATIVPDGTITVMGAGTAQITITASETDEWKEAQKVITITVNPKASGGSQKPEDTQKPEASQKPENTQKPDSQKPEEPNQPSNKQVITASDLVKTVGDPAFSLGAETNGDGILSFYSHQPDVVTVNSSGMAEAISAGTAQITVRASATELWEAAETTITVTVIPENYTPIYDIADLYAIRNNPDGNYILVNDIDMSAATSKGGDYDCGTGWDSIETFSGTLDGNGHKIIGMHIFGEFSDDIGICVGLFEAVSGDIKNLGIIDCEIDISLKDFDKSLYLGALVAKVVNNGRIDNCYSGGTIRVNGSVSQTTYYKCIGGLIGGGGDSITNCFNACAINSDIEGVSIGGISGSGRKISGGVWEYCSSIRFCYNYGKINASEISKVGAICGSFTDISNCSYLKGTAVQGIGDEQDNSDCVSLTEAQMRNPKLFTGFDFTDTWEIDPYCSYPYPQLKNNQMVRVDSIRITSAPHKLVYGQGDAINVSGGIMEIVYEDGIKTSIPLATEMLSGYDMAQLGKQTVWVHYGNAYISFEIEVKEVAVSSVTLPESLSLYRGKEQRLDAVVLPANASNPSLAWNSDNPAVAVVDGNGLVKAKAGGTATITATSVNGIQAKCVVSVIVPCVSIELSSNSLFLKEGTSAVLTAQILPLESNDTVQWASSNEEVAEVYDGTVVAKKAGTAVITASTGSGIKESCKVTVKKAATTPGTQTITAKDIKKTYGVKPFALGAKANGGGKLSYSVENKKVARIDKNGKVTVTGCGVTEIEIHAAANGAYDEAEETITLTVVPKKLTVSSVKSQKSKSVTVKWKKDAKASGYIIEYSTDKKFRKSVKTAIVSKNKTTSKTITKLKAGKKYYVRACAYTMADGERIKGAYSKTKTVKIKK